MWQSSITLCVSIIHASSRYFQFPYGAETWSVTVTLSRTIDALDNRCLWRIDIILVRICHQRRDKCSCTGQWAHFYQTLSAVAVCSSLDIFTVPTPGRITSKLSRSASGAHISNHWRRGIGRLRQSWLRTVEAHLRPMNLGLATAKRRAQDRSAWRKLVSRGKS